MKVSKGLIIKNRYNGTWLCFAYEKLQAGNRNTKIELMSLIEKFLDDMLML